MLRRRRIALPARYRSRIQTSSYVYGFFGILIVVMGYMWTSADAQNNLQQKIADRGMTSTAQYLCDNFTKITKEKKLTRIQNAKLQAFYKTNCNKKTYHTSGGGSVVNGTDGTIGSGENMNERGTSIESVGMKIAGTSVVRETQKIYGQQVSIDVVVDSIVRRAKRMQIKQDFFLEDTTKTRVRISKDTVIAPAKDEAIDPTALTLMPVINKNKKIREFMFGVENQHLIFSQPVQVEMPLEGYANGMQVGVKVKHLGDTEYNTKGLSTSMDTSCTITGETTKPNNIVTVQDNKIVFYTCGASTFIVDDIGLVPAAIYGLRKLNSTYAGSFIRVRRSSDNTEQDIGMTVSGELNTGALMTFVGVGNGFITTWYDQSGNGRNFTQTVAGNQPRIVNGGVLDTINNGKPGIRWFDANGARLLQTAVAPFGSANELTVILVHKEIVRQNNVAWSLANDGQGVGRIFSHIPWSDGNLYFDVGGCCNTPQRLAGAYPFSIGTTNTLTYTNSVSNNTKNVYGNGNMFLSGPAAAGTIVQLRIGSEGGIAINGMISEFMIFNSSISTTQRKVIEQSQAAYYNIGGTSYIPESPTNLTGVGGNTIVPLSWVAPIYIGGSPLTDYIVEYRVKNTTGWTIFADGVNVSTTITVTGLTNGINYEFRVSAKNINGQSTPSSIITVRPGIVTITAPSTLNMQSISANLSIQNIDTSFLSTGQLFVISDTKGIDNGYNTTLQMSGNLTNTSIGGGINISASNIGLVGIPYPTLISGNTNTNVQPTSGNTGAFRPLSTIQQLIWRNTGINNGVVGTYGIGITLRVNVPAAQPVGIYQGMLVYTLIEN